MMLCYYRFCLLSCRQIQESSIEKMNGTSVTEFLLLGLSVNPKVQIILFVIFLVVYIITLSGNIILITACVCDPCLHTAMYFFLTNLSFIDLFYSSTLVPKMLVQLIGRNRIQYSACAAQMYIFMVLACTECLLLAVMAYDRFVAISLALRYNLIMSKPVCITLATCCWVSGSLLAVLDTFFTLQVSFCDNNIIDHFFCEPSALVKIACTDSFIAEMVIFFVGGVVLLVPIFICLFSYISIIITIVGIRSAEGRYKAFSTCISHMIVITLTGGPALFMYMKPVSKKQDNQEKMVSLFYTVIPPALNPIIYSLRNRDVKKALQKLTLTNLFQY
ncbi:olfactory receptor 2D2-like [Lissotriton helveticus]